MASLDLVMTMTARKRWEDSDGTPCVFCGDVSYLKQMRLVVDIEETGKTVDSGNVFCQSCGEILDDETEPTWRN